MEEEPRPIPLTQQEKDRRRQVKRIRASIFGSESPPSYLLKKKSGKSEQNEVEKSSNETVLFLTYHQTVDSKKIEDFLIVSRTPSQLLNELRHCSNAFVAKKGRALAIQYVNLQRATGQQWLQEATQFL